MVGTETFSFVAANAYYLQEEGTRAQGDLQALAYRSTSVAETFAKLSALGVRAVRCPAFNDGTGRVGTIQRAPLEYDETGLRGLDLVVARAREYHVRLILPLVNYWDDYGGVRQYVRWHGYPDARTGDARFFTERPIVEHFKAHLERVIGRVNTLTGVGYWEDPTIMAWELINEPRGLGLDHGGNDLRAWIDEVAHHVRELAPEQLVGTGEEGFDVERGGYDEVFWSRAGASWMAQQGQSFTLDTASPYVDFASVHLYPEGYGWPAGAVEEAGSRWIAEHSAIAASLGKPLLVGEFGLANDGSPRAPRATLPLEARRRIYERWLSVGARVAGGMAPWLFAYDRRPDSDPYTWYFRDGTAPSDPRNRYADLVVAAAMTANRRR